MFRSERELHVGHVEAVMFTFVRRATIDSRLMWGALLAFRALIISPGKRPSRLRRVRRGCVSRTSTQQLFEIAWDRILGDGERQMVNEIADITMIESCETALSS
jgi:hypothetical protein